MRPLENITVLEFCQYMSGPSAGLRLADMGARVIKIEKEQGGENGRQLAVKNLFLDDSSLLFHTINRNKESYAVNLKNAEGIRKIQKLIEHADVLIHNFRPGVMEKLHLGYEVVKQINPRIVYGVITGYSDSGPWKNKPGQDLLIQSLSGLAWLSGNRNDPPVPFGISIADYMCGTHLVQGILAALIKRTKTNNGALVQVNLLSSLIDLQFEVITTFLNDGGQLPRRSLNGNGHAYLPAPYGIYATRNGYLVIAMTDLKHLGHVLDLPLVDEHTDSFAQRDNIMAKLQDHLKRHDTSHWISLLQHADIWCADVYDYNQLVKQEGYKTLEMEQIVSLHNNISYTTTRCPIRIDREKYFSNKPAPAAGEHTEQIDQEFELSTNN